MTWQDPCRLTPTVQIPPGKGKNGIQLQVRIKRMIVSMRNDDFRLKNDDSVQMLGIGGGIEIMVGPYAGAMFY